MGSYDSAGLGGPQADPGSSPHGFAAEETRSLRLLDDPGRGSLALYRIVAAQLRRAGALPTPTGAGPRAPRSGRAGARVTRAVIRAEGLAGRGYPYRTAGTRMPLRLFSARHEPEGTTAAQGFGFISCTGQQPRHEPGPTCIIPDAARVAPA